MVIRKTPTPKALKRSRAVQQHKAKAEKGFFDEEQRRTELLAHKDPLCRLNEVVDWELFRPTLEQALHREANGLGGRPSFD